MEGDKKWGHVFDSDDDEMMMEIDLENLPEACKEGRGHDEPVKTMMHLGNDGQDSLLSGAQLQPGSSHAYTEPIGSPVPLLNLMLSPEDVKKKLFNDELMAKKVSVYSRGMPFTYSAVGLFSDMPKIGRVYVDGADSSYIKEWKAKMKARKASVIFCKGWDEDVTHFLADTNVQTGLFTGTNFFMALARNVYILYRSWLSSGKGRLLMNEDLCHVDVALDYPLAELRPMYRQKKVFEKIRFLFLAMFPFQHFMLQKISLQKILIAAGGVIMESDASNPRELYENIEIAKDGAPTIILATTIGEKQRECNQIYVDRRWITLSPQYILDCLWRGKICDLELRHVFTTGLVLSANA